MNIKLEFIWYLLRKLILWIHIVQNWMNFYKWRMYSASTSASRVFVTFKSSEVLLHCDSEVRQERIFKCKIFYFCVDLPGNFHSRENQDVIMLSRARLHGSQWSHTKSCIYNSQPCQGRWYLVQYAAIYHNQNVKSLWSTSSFVHTKQFKILFLRRIYLDFMFMCVYVPKTNQ